MTDRVTDRVTGPVADRVAGWETGPVTVSVPGRPHGTARTPRIRQE
ncbi:hypothetical protein [Streptomyces sp. MAR25Y5]|nr:hypothetical protein [Streptomyces sp. MAR25Y5]MCP3765624.1 hypothetical protein [Streptomyces sp. MAR25Y5]